MNDERERDIHRRPAPPVPEPVIQGARDARLAEPPTQEDFAGTIGAQVVLPPDSAAAAGAKGVYPTIVENTLLRNAGYEEMGLDPQDPSGEVTDPDVPPEPPGGGNGGGSETAPVNTAVPAVTQSGTTLSCTMGIWTGEPTSYAYQWKLDGVDAGTGTADYAVQAGDVGKSATCVVTATNAHGSTAAPPSVGVVIT
jgi:hypothetical protein